MTRGVVLVVGTVGMVVWEGTAVRRVEGGSGCNFEGGPAPAVNKSDG